MGKLADIINTRPITVVAAITAIHSLVYGIGMVFGVGGFRETVLYRNVSEVSNPDMIGWILILVGITSGAAFLTKHSKILSAASLIQSLTWLFIALSYAVHGEWMLGLGAAFLWSVLSSYMAYLWKNQDFVVRHARTEQAPM